MFELLLAEYGLEPTWLQENWTDELLQLMLEKREERFIRMQPNQEKVSKGYMSNEDFFEKHKGKIGYKEIPLGRR